MLQQWGATDAAADALTLGPVDYTRRRTFIVSTTEREPCNPFCSINICDHQDRPQAQPARSVQWYSTICLMLKHVSHTVQTEPSRA